MMRDEEVQELIDSVGRDDLNTFNRLMGIYDRDAVRHTLDGLELETYLLFAAAAGRGANVVEALVSRGVDVNTLDQDGDAALYVASGNRNREAVEALIAHGANVNHRGRIATALHAAAMIGDAEIASLLLRAGADPKSRMPNGDTPWILATRNGHRKVLQQLDIYGANLDALLAAGFVVQHPRGKQRPLAWLTKMLRR